MISTSVEQIELSHKIGREQIEGRIEPIIDEFDHVIIDTPPSLGLLSINAMSAPTAVVPVRQNIIHLKDFQCL